MKETNTELNKITTEFIKEQYIRDIHYKMIDVYMDGRCLWCGNKNINFNIKAISIKYACIKNDNVYIKDINTIVHSGHMYYMIADNIIYRVYKYMEADDCTIYDTIKIRELTPLEIMIGAVETDLGTIEF